jgi:hypothetical protein
MKATILNIIVSIYFASTACHCNLDDCLFAHSYKLDELFLLKENQHDFLMQMSWWEGKFATDGIGVNFYTGLTFRGVYLELQTGGAAAAFVSGNSDRSVTMPQYEAIHLSLLTAALDGNKYALNFFNSSLQDSGWSRTAKEFVVDQMKKKINCYVDFHYRYPGFGGYLPVTVELTREGLKLYETNLDGYAHGALSWALVSAFQVSLEKKSS